jgi:hypothetical protein
MAIQIDAKCSPHRENHEDDRLRLTDEKLARLFQPTSLRGLVERG